MNQDPNMPSDPRQQPQPMPYPQEHRYYPQQDPPQYGQQPHPGPHPQTHWGRDGLPPLPRAPFQADKRPFGIWFWIMTVILSVLVLGNMAAGRGEAILIILGLAAAVTGLIAMGSERRTWANLPTRKAAIAVCLAGTASLLVGSVAAGVGASQERAAAPMTSAQLEASAAAKLKDREDALAKSEADSATKLKTREDAVAQREAAVGTAEKNAAKTLGQGIWTVGTDIEPGTYRTTKAVVGDCSWKITRTGSNGKDYIAYDYFVKGGFPEVNLVEGQTFDTDGCGDWAKK